MVSSYYYSFWERDKKSFEAATGEVTMVLFFSSSCYIQCQDWGFSYVFHLCFFSQFNDEVFLNRNGMFNLCRTHPLENLIVSCPPLPRTIDSQNFAQAGNISGQAKQKVKPILKNRASSLSYRQPVLCLCLYPSQNADLHSADHRPCFARSPTIQTSFFHTNYGTVPVESNEKF